MAKRLKFGANTEGFLINQSITVGTTALEAIFPLDEIDFASFQLVTENYTRSLTITNTDHVVASTKTWTFATGGFTSLDVGATFAVAGATHSGLNTSFVVASVTNATTIVSVASPSNDETFNAAAVTVSVTDAPLTGAWTVLISNDYSVQYIQPANAGHWADITSQLTPAIAAVTVASDQFVQLAPIAARTAKVVFTPATKRGLVSVFVYGRAAA